MQRLPTPEAAKSAGSKSGMKKYGVILDVRSWNEKKLEIMNSLIQSKIERHIEIQQILRIVKERNIHLVHFSRMDMEWGAHVDTDGIISKGENLLGNIYMSNLALI